jgi:hypothetical protein
LRFGVRAFLQDARFLDHRRRTAGREYPGRDRLNYERWRDAGFAPGFIGSTTTINMRATAE